MSTPVPDYYPGKDCQCCASSEIECGCSNVDWTPSEVYQLNEELASLQSQHARLKTAAQELVRRWHTPLWKDVPATAIFINQLESALITPPQNQL